MNIHTARKPIVPVVETFRPIIVTIELETELDLKVLREITMLDSTIPRAVNAALGRPGMDSALAMLQVLGTSLARI